MLPEAAKVSATAAENCESTATMMRGTTIKEEVSATKVMSEWSSYTPFKRRATGRARETNITYTIVEKICEYLEV